MSDSGRPPDRHDWRGHWLKGVDHRKDRIVVRYFTLQSLSEIRPTKSNTTGVVMITVDVFYSSWVLRLLEPPFSHGWCICPDIYRSLPDEGKRAGYKPVLPHSPRGSETRVVLGSPDPGRSTGWGRVTRGVSEVGWPCEEECDHTCSQCRRGFLLVQERGSPFIFINIYKIFFFYIKDTQRSLNRGRFITVCRILPFWDPCVLRQ